MTTTLDIRLDMNRVLSDYCRYPFDADTFNKLIMHLRSYMWYFLNTEDAVTCIDSLVSELRNATIILINKGCSGDSSVLFAVISKLIGLLLKEMDIYGGF